MAWKVLSSTLGLAVPYLSPPARTAVGLIGKFERFRTSVLDAKDNQQMVEYLYERAESVSARIASSRAERRPQDEAFTALVSSFRTTLEGVEDFYEKFWQQGWFQRLLRGEEVKSEFQGLLMRLEAHDSDHKTLLLQQIAYGDPCERIDHPQLVFAKTTRSGTSNKRIRIENSTTGTLMEVQFWKGYWKRGCHKAHQTLQLLVAANQKIYGGGSDEIGDFTCSGQLLGNQVHFVKHYIGRHQVEYDGALSKTTIGGSWTKERGNARKGSFRLKQRLDCYQSITPREESGIVRVDVIQPWTGLYTDRGGTKNPRRMRAKIVFTHNHKIYGSGEDSVGPFTWFGRYHQRSHLTLVSISQQYVGKHVVHLVAAVATSFSVGEDHFKVVMEGSWTHSNDLEKGTFSLQPQLSSNSFPA